MLEDMARRVVSLSLLLALLLTQWVNGHRRYDGCSACGRPPAPHVHLREVLPTGDRPRPCRCAARATEEADQRCCGGTTAARCDAMVVAEPATAPRGCCDDVLLLPAHAELTLPKSPPVEGDSTSAADAVPPPSMASGRPAARPGTESPRSKAAGRSSRPLYILTRSLLL